MLELDDLWTARSEDIEKLVRYNLSDQGREQIGLTRPLPPMTFSIPHSGARENVTDRSGMVRADDGIVWATRLGVEGAHALRLRIATRSLPPESQIWLISAPGAGGRSQASGPHSTKRLDGRGELLLPPVGGSDMGLEDGFESGVASWSTAVP